MTSFHRGGSNLANEDPYGLQVLAGVLTAAENAVIPDDYETERAAVAPEVLVASTAFTEDEVSRENSDWISPPRR